MYKINLMAALTLRVLR